MQTLAEIQVDIETDRQHVARELQERLEGEGCSIVPTPSGFIIQKDLTGVSGQHRVRLQSRVNSAVKLGLRIQKYSIEQLDMEPPGSAKVTGWNHHIPKLPNGRTNFHWNHQAVNFHLALDKVLIPNGTLDPQNPFSDTTIKVFQFDTGYSDHPALQNYDGYDTTSTNCISAVQGLSPKDELKSFRLAFGSFQKPAHGTATAGTMIAQPEIAANQWPDAPEEFPLTMADGEIVKFFRTPMAKGLFPYVQFVPIKLSETVTLGGGFAGSILKGVGYRDNIIPALRHASAKGAHVVTMSMGGKMKSKKIQQAFREAYEAGIIMVCAAGNRKLADVTQNVVQPASFPYTIGVAGVEPRVIGGSDELIPWSQSCDGKEVDISAPAKYIYTPTCLDPRRFEEADVRERVGDGFLYKMGGATSQATVHVASAAALWSYYYREKLQGRYFSKYLDDDGKMRDNRWRKIEAFRYALYASRFIPQNEEWSGNVPIEYKGVLDVDAMLDDNCSPTSENCKKYLAYVWQRDKKKRKRERKKRIQGRWELFTDLHRKSSDDGGFVDPKPVGEVRGN